MRLTTCAPGSFRRAAQHDHPRGGPGRREFRYADLVSTRPAAAPGRDQGVVGADGDVRAPHGRRRPARRRPRQAAPGRLRPRGVAAARPRGGGWMTVDHDRTDGKGRYVLAWRAAKTGTKRVRVHFGGTRELSSARHLAGTARIYRRALASWYGPGLYGGHLACGGTLTPRHARRRQQVAAVRHEGDAALPGAHRARPRRRPRPLRRRPRVRPDRRHEGQARLRLDRHGPHDALARVTRHPRGDDVA